MITDKRFKKAKPITDVQIKNIAEKCKNLSIEELKKKLLSRTTRNPKPPTLEQKVLILKLLQLNDMKYRETEKMVNVSRQTIAKWVRDIGPIVFTSEPEKIVAKEIETSLAVIQGDTLKKAYRMLNFGLDKLHDLASQATGTRGIYAVAEAIRATTEVIKIEKDLGDAGKVQGTEFFMNVHNLMIQNKYGNGNSD